MNIKPQVFGINSVQNFRTMAIIARREGIERTEDLIAWLDRYITNEFKELARGRKQVEPDVGGFIDITQREQHKAIRRQVTFVRRSNSEKMRLSTLCPECGKGRVVENLREGAIVRSCTYPKMSGGFIKFDSGCGYSRMVD